MLGEAPSSFPTTKSLQQQNMSCILTRRSVQSIAIASSPATPISQLYRDPHFFSSRDSAFDRLLDFSDDRDRADATCYGVANCHTFKQMVAERLGISEGEDVKEHLIRSGFCFSLGQVDGILRNGCGTNILHLALQDGNHNYFPVLTAPGATGIIRAQFQNKRFKVGLLELDIPHPLAGLLVTETITFQH